MWHEGVGKRGSNNIASCIWQYLITNAHQAEEFHFFTDNCSGQNKNKQLLPMYLHAVNTVNISTICHYYLERGHIQNEGDCMHSVIEAAAKRINIYTPMQWYMVAGTAKKKGEPYKVIEMDCKMKDFGSCGYMKGNRRNSIR